MKKVHPESISFTPLLPAMSLLSLAILVSSCGGGGSPESFYPDCSAEATGTDNIAGCWVSEVCGSGGETKETWDALGVRYLTRIIQDPIGGIETYYLRYNNPQCSGTPFAIFDREEEMNEAKALSSTRSTKQTIFGAYDGSILNQRLCFSKLIYSGFNPDDASDFGIGSSGFTTRNTELDYTNCLVKFTP